jgi:hypothetical protein
VANVRAIKAPTLVLITVILKLPNYYPTTESELILIVWIG